MRCVALKSPSLGNSRHLQNPCACPGAANRYTIRSSRPNFGKMKRKGVVECQAFEGICTSVTSDSVSGAIDEIQEAKASGADLVELRLDFIKDFKPETDLDELMKNCPMPYIVTYRPVWEGGNYDGEESKRIGTLQKAAISGAPFVDIELKAAKSFFAMKDKTNPASTIILSYHDFKETPTQEVLDEKINSMWKEGAQIVKIAAMANDITDCDRMINLLKEQKGPTIALSMGERGQMTRILAPKYGGFLTFGALGAGRESAPGQTTVQELREMYRLSDMEASSKVFGIIGNPVSHSRSPVLHNRCMAEVGYDGVYVPLLVDDLPKFLDTYNEPDFAGFSVTIPHKEAALECAGEVDTVAGQIGACNTLVRSPDGSLKGYNTDWSAAISAIEKELEIANNPSLNGKTVVVIGAGGAAKAIAFGAASKGAKVVIANRSADRAKALAESIVGGAEVASLSDLQSGNVKGDVLANTTSLGMHPNEDVSPVPKSALSNFLLVFDAVYTPMVTKLLREAEEMGCKTVSGVEMFVGQASDQFQLFTNKDSPVELMKDVVVASLAN